MDLVDQLNEMGDADFEDLVEPADYASRFVRKRIDVKTMGELAPIYKVDWGTFSHAYEKKQNRKTGIVNLQRFHTPEDLVYKRSHEAAETWSSRYTVRRVN